METIQVGNKNIELDDEGFLVNSEEWNEDVARKLAEREGVAPLDDHKLEIIRFMREYYNKFHFFPILNYVCKNLDQPRECLNEEFVNPMLAWKLAGLPKMDGIEFANVRGDHYIMQECC